MVDWTPGRIAALTIEKVKALRNNAIRGGKDTLVELCDNDLANRARPRSNSPRGQRSPGSRNGQVVVGFHFVCDREKGVTANSDGTLWTGTWVVDEAHARKAAKNGAYVALHTARSERSYLQGIVKDWRKTKREPEYGGRPVKIESGIDFLLIPTSNTHEWVGDGTGEKGYAWSAQNSTSGQ